MAAKFEVYMISEAYFDIRQCNTLFSRIGETVFSQDCVIWDSWLPEKEEMVKIQDVISLKKRLLNGNIIHFQGTIGSFPVGAMQYFGHGQFHTQQWIDTANLPELDTDSPNEFCTSFCQSAAERLMELSQQVNIKFFAMGTEMVLYDSEQLEEILHKSYHILYYGMKQNNHFLTCYR